MRSLLLSAICLVSCSVLANAQIAEPCLKWQNYEQTGYVQTKRVAFQSSELALTNRLQTLLAQETPPEKSIESYLERLVSLCMYQGNYATAEQYATLAIRFGSKINLDAQHQATLHATLAKVYFKEGKQTQAELEYNKCLSMLGSQPSDSSAKEAVARCQLGLAELMTEQHKSEQADKLFKTAFVLISQTPPDLVSYAKNLFQLRRLNEAHDALANALEIDRRQLGEGQPSLAAEYNDLAIVCFQQDDIQAAEKNMVEAVNIARKNRYTDLADWIQNLSTIFDKEGKHSEALTLRQECDLLKRKAVSNAGSKSSDSH